MASINMGRAEHIAMTESQPVVSTAESETARRPLAAEPATSTTPEKEGWPLSFAQQRLWFLDQLEPNSALYNMPCALKLIGEFRLEAFEKALNALAARHEVLRARFVSMDGQPRQVIEPEVAVRVRVIDCTKDCAANGIPEVAALIRQEINEPFDLASAPLLRALVIRCSQREHVLVLTMHHIVSDEWSLQIIFKELGELYQQFSAGRRPELPELRIRYVDYCSSQREDLNEDAPHLAYWKKQLSGNPPLTELPTSWARKASPAFRGTLASKKLNRISRQELEDFSRKERVTPFLVLLAAFEALVYRYTGQLDLIVATPMAGRAHLDTENVVGFFVNTVLLRTEVSGDPAFNVLLKRVRDVLLGAYAHQDLPLEKLVQELQPQRSLNHLPFTRLMFMTQHDFPENLRWGDLELEFLDAATDTAKFDLTLDVRQLSSGLVASVEYDVDLFDGSFIARLLGHYENILTGILRDPACPISRLPLLSPAESKQLLQEWNTTASDYPREKSIHEVFQEQAARTPAAIAL